MQARAGCVLAWGGRRNRVGRASGTHRIGLGGCGCQLLRASLQPRQVLLQAQHLPRASMIVTWGWRSVEN